MAEKDNLLEILIKFSKILIKFLRKLSKIKNFLKEDVETLIILAYFQKHLTNHALIFCAFGRKRQFIGNFEKIFVKFPSENC